MQRPRSLTRTLADAEKRPQRGSRHPWMANMAVWRLLRGSEPLESARKGRGTRPDWHCSFVASTSEQIGVAPPDARERYGGEAMRSALHGASKRNAEGDRLQIPREGVGGRAFLLHVTGWSRRAADLIRPGPPLFLLRLSEQARRSLRALMKIGREVPSLRCDQRLLQETDPLDCSNVYALSCHICVYDLRECTRLHQPKDGHPSSQNPKVADTSFLV